MSADGKLILITGATAGIGKAAAVQLARQGAELILPCRSEERGQAARREIVARSGAKESKLQLVPGVDLSDQGSIRRFAAQVKDERQALHVLLNNAGVILQERQTSPQGHELTFATNALGYFLLTEELLPLLERSAPSRIVNVASELARDLDLDDLMFESRPYDMVKAYAQSKQANRMLTYALAERLPEGVTVNALHPGMVATELARDAGGIFGFFLRLAFSWFGRSVDKGADTAVWLASSPQVEGQSGLFWTDRQRAPMRFKDPDQCRQLEARCRQLVGLDEAGPS